MASVGTRTLERVRREAVRNGHQPVTVEPLIAPGMVFTNAQKKSSREPIMIGEVLNTFYASKSVAKSLLLPQICEAWEQIVGTLVAQHTKPKTLKDDVLYVESDSTVWASQLSVLGPILVNKINTITKEKTVTRIQISGPKANVPNYGPRTVKGRVGYRDTFG